jgi:hypothetical protein
MWLGITEITAHHRAPGRGILGSTLGVSDASSHRFSRFMHRFTTLCRQRG